MLTALLLLAFQSPFQQALDRLPPGATIYADQYAPRVKTDVVVHQSVIIVGGVFVEAPGATQAILAIGPGKLVLDHAIVYGDVLSTDILVMDWCAVAGKCLARAAYLRNSRVVADRYRPAVEADIVDVLHAYVRGGPHPTCGPGEVAVRGRQLTTRGPKYTLLGGACGSGPRGPALDVAQWIQL